MSERDELRKLVDYTIEQIEFGHTSGALGYLAKMKNMLSATEAAPSGPIARSFNEEGTEQLPAEPAHSAIRRNHEN